MTTKLTQAPGALGPMNTARSRAYRLHPCGCPRETTQILKREGGGANTPVSLVYSPSHGDHDPRVPHALKVPCRARREDTWPGRP